MTWIAKAQPARALRRWHRQLRSVTDRGGASGRCSDARWVIVAETVQADDDGLGGALLHRCDLRQPDESPRPHRSGEGHTATLLRASHGLISETGFLLSLLPSCKHVQPNHLTPANCNVLLNSVRSMVTCWRLSVGFAGPVDDLM